MAVGDKEWTLNQLRNVRNCYLCILGAMRLLNGRTVLTLRNRVVLLREEEILWDPRPADREGRRHEVDLGQLAHSYEHDKAAYEVTLRNLYNFARRNLVTESFEAVKTYSIAAHIMPKLRSEAWFPFARIIRNAVAHNFIIHFDKHDLARLPIIWNGKAIDRALEGQEIAGSLLDPQITLDLLHAMEAFVQAN
jgi:hypothetical protein